MNEPNKKNKLITFIKTSILITIIYILFFLALEWYDNHKRYNIQEKYRPVLVQSDWQTRIDMTKPLKDYPYTTNKLDY